MMTHLLSRGISNGEKYLIGANGGRSCYVGLLAS